MTTLDDKKFYVASQAQTRDHVCHWPGCDKQVPPALWGCKEHWLILPRRLRNKIWRAFRPGQEIDLNPSADYLAAAAEVQDWIKAKIAADASPIAGAM